MAEKKAKAVIKKSTKVQFLATGRRKKAIARVFLIPNGPGHAFYSARNTG